MSVTNVFQPQYIYFEAKRQKVGKLSGLKQQEQRQIILANPTEHPKEN